MVLAFHDTKLLAGGPPAVGHNPLSDAFAYLLGTSYHFILYETRGVSTRTPVSGPGINPKSEGQNPREVPRRYSQAVRVAGVGFRMLDVTKHTEEVPTTTGP